MLPPISGPASRGIRSRTGARPWGPEDAISVKRGHSTPSKGVPERVMLRAKCRYRLGMAGEDNHDAGEYGVRRAKTWLERTTRVKTCWTRHDGLQADLLKHSWPFGNQNEFTFDLGGLFQGDSLDQQGFLAEVKNHKAGGNLPKEFREFLARSYVAAGVRPATTHFVWIAWAPFSSSTWDQHCSIDSIKNACVDPLHRTRVTGEENEAEAIASLDLDRLASMADRVWKVTLSTRQEELVPALKHFEMLRGSIARDELGAS